MLDTLNSHRVNVTFCRVSEKTVFSVTRKVNELFAASPFVVPTRSRTLESFVERFMHAWATPHSDISTPQ